MRDRFAFQLAILILSGLLGIAHAQETTPAPSAQLVKLTAEDLESFLGPLIAEQLEKSKAAGAVVSVIKDGAILFTKGYGYADVEKKIPMTADATLVRPGSISKLFTGIAVMQLVEKGMLDLDRDVNEYLDFTVPTPPGGVPVTLRLLMTHRAGFEEQAKGVFTDQPVPEPLGPWLKKRLPQRLFPKGDVSAYSNYGVALAGYIVERVSGQPYADYIEANIFTPLGMLRSTFRQPPPAELMAMASRGYVDTQTPPLPYYETISLAPAGALAATANDMGRFMLALVSDGAHDGHRILYAQFAVG